MRTSEDISKIAPAFVQLQALLDRKFVKDSTAEIDGRSYHHGSLPASIAYTRDAMALCELSLSQDIVNIDGGRGISVTTRMIHTSGQWYEWGPLDIECDRDARSVGSATTYGRRTTRNAALDIAPDEDEDDDGAAATPVRTTDAPAPRTAKAPERRAEPKNATIAQVGRIFSVGKQSGMTEDEVVAEVQKRFGVDHPDDLTKRPARAEVSAYITELERRVKAAGGDEA